MEKGESLTQVLCERTGSGVAAHSHCCCYWKDSAWWWCSAQWASGTGDRAVPAISMRGLLPPRTPLVHAYLCVPCLATGCWQPWHSPDLSTRQSFAQWLTQCFHVLSCSPLCPLSPLWGRVRSPGVEPLCCSLSHAILWSISFPQYASVYLHWHLLGLVLTCSSTSGTSTLQGFL